MKKFNLVVAMAAFSVISTAAFADGFTCMTDKGDLNVKVYNHTDPQVGTRVAAILVLSDPAVGVGNKTIARFEDVEGNLTSSGASYDANVDLRYKNSSRKGELILGTKLGELKTVTLDIDFSYSAPVETGTEVAAVLHAYKRNGEIIRAEATCTRYLKD